MHDISRSMAIYQEIITFTVPSLKNHNTVRKNFFDKSCELRLKIKQKSKCVVDAYDVT